MPAHPDIKGKSWQVTRWAPFFSLGKLCELMQHACPPSGTLSSSTRASFAQSIKQIEKSFAALPKDEDGSQFALTALQRMQALLEQKQDSELLCQDLEPQLLMLTDTLSLF